MPILPAKFQRKRPSFPFIISVIDFGWRILRDATRNALALAGPNYSPTSPETPATPPAIHSSARPSPRCADAVNSNSAACRKFRPSETTHRILPPRLRRRPIQPYPPPPDAPSTPHAPESGGFARYRSLPRATELPKLRLQPPHYVIMRHRLASARKPRRHSRAPHPVAADAGGNVPAILLHPPVHQRHIGLLHLALGKLGASLRCASSFFATTISPLVSLSRRWTIPGRSSPPTADKLAK